MPAPTGTTHVLDVEYLIARLDIQREERGLTWTQVAREIGTSENTLSSVRTRGRVPHVDIVLSAAAWLNHVEMDRLIMKRGTVWT